VSVQITERTQRRLALESMSWSRMSGLEQALGAGGSLVFILASLDENLWLMGAALAAVLVGRWLWRVRSARRFSDRLRELRTEVQP
jgi:hypothetical protein